MTDPGDFNNEVRDYKPLLLISVSLFLIVISIVLLSGWVFDFGTKAKPAKSVVPAKTEEQSSPIKLPNNYDSAVHLLDSMLTATIKKTDSLEYLLNVKMEDLSRMQQEIKDILNTPDKKGNLPEANKKISRLKNKVNKLKNNYKPDASINKSEKNNRGELSNPPIKQAEKSIKLDFIMTEINMSAAYYEEDKNINTTDASQAEKLTGYFSIRNASEPSAAIEIVIVIIDPNGQIMNTGWDSGNFLTAQGTKQYTCKLTFDCSPEATKRIAFAIPLDNPKPGRYTGEAYFAGILVGRCNAKLQ